MINHLNSKLLEKKIMFNNFKEHAISGYISNHAMYQNNPHESIKIRKQRPKHKSKAPQKKKHYPLGRVSFMSNRESETINIRALAMNGSKFLKGEVDFRVGYGIASVAQHLQHSSP